MTSREPPQAPQKSLRLRAFRAGAWTLAGHFSNLLLRFVGTIILTRIFAPDAFGVLTVVMAVQVILALLTDIGLRQAVIQSPNGEAFELLSTAFTLQIFRGFFIWGLGGVFALGVSIASAKQWLPVHSAYGDPDLPTYLVVACASAAILGFQSMKVARAIRRVEIKPILLIELLSQFLSLAFIVVVGWLTVSLWSYIFGQLVAALVVVVSSHLVLKGPADRLGWNGVSAKELFRFGSTLSAIATNGDRLLLGAWLSSQVLGFYSIAYNLASVPEGLANRVFGAVAFPALSEAARARVERVPEIYFRMRWITDLGLLGLSGILFAGGPAIVGLLYDPRYASAGWMLQYLSLGLVFSRYAISQQAFLALGRPEYLSALSASKLVSLFLFMFLGFSFFGVEGAVLGVATHLLPNSILMFYFSSKHNLNSIRLEVGVLVAWWAGWLIGLGIERFV
mgnify:FL=1